MAGYEKQTWTDKISDVTAERMNHIEKGIEDAGKTGGVETGSVIGWTGAEIPEGYEEVDSSLLPSNSGVEVGAIVEFDDNVALPEGWETISPYMPTPDFTQREKITLDMDTPYTITEDAFFQISCKCLTNAAAVVSLMANNVVMLYWQVNNAMQTVFPATPLKKGTVLKLDNINTNTELSIYKVPILNKTQVKKVSVTPIDPITGSIVDGTNIDNKATNTYSANVIDGTVLYENSSGSNESITLSDNGANYKYLDIFFRENGGRKSGIRITPINGARYVLMTATPTNDIVYLKIAQYSLSGANFNLDIGVEQRLGGTAYATQVLNNLYIEKVVGYKY